MPVSHAASAVFHEPNLISCAESAPVLAFGGVDRSVWDPERYLRGQRGNTDAGGGRRHVGGPGLDRRPGPAALRRYWPDVLATSGAPSTFLHSFTACHVRQLDAVAARLLAHLRR